MSWLLILWTGSRDEVREARMVTSGVRPRTLLFLLLLLLLLCYVTRTKLHSHICLMTMSKQLKQIFWIRLLIWTSSNI